jgi:hypothetical protein
MIVNRPNRLMPSAPVVADLLSMTTVAFPTWALLVSSLYLMFVCGLHSLDIRRLWN